MKIINLEEIKAILVDLDPVAMIEEGFSLFSSGKVVVPPVGELCFESPPGEMHIKYGYIKQNDVYVIKIASGFFENSKQGLANGNGMMLVFNQKTGQPLALLNDHGFLTDVRTAVAGAVCAKYLAAPKITTIGIIGNGVQAQMQLKYLKNIIDCNHVVVWGRNPDSVKKYIHEMQQLDYDIESVPSANHVADQSQLIITCTASDTALIDRMSPGCHITAMGSDTPGKQELASTLLQEADVVVTDSRPQSFERGEIHQAMKSGFDTKQVVEIGEIILGLKKGRTQATDKTIADLTGVAIQDIQIAKAIVQASEKSR